MAAQIFSNANTIINGVSLKAVTVTVEQASAEVDVLKMGDTASNSKLGLATGDKFSLSFIQDYASGSVAETLAAAYANCVSGGTANVVIFPTASAVGAANPRYTLVGVIPSYSPIPGVNTGDKGIVTIEVKPSGTAIAVAYA